MAKADGPALTGDAVELAGSWLGAGSAGESGGGDASADLSRDDDARYEPGLELGRGAMGRVYLAHDARLARDVAVKEASSAANESLLLRESRIVASLEHPSILPVYDLSFREDGSLFLVMRVLRGEMLADVLARNPPRVERLGLLRHILAACEAIGWAHRRGVVHRDIKPAHIMVGAFGETQIIDWGLAHAEGEAELTGVAGTPAYMAPEQRRGAAPEPRQDVYALGLVLFEVIAGPLPRTREVALGKAAIAQRVGPPLAELGAIVARALAADPAQRYADAKELADDLARYLDGRRVAAHAYRRRELVWRYVRKWRWPLAAIGVTVLVAAVGLVLAFVDAAAERDAAEAAAGRANQALHASLVDRALQLQREGRASEAMALARQALAISASPKALGVVSSVAATARPTRESTVSMGTRCLDAALSGGSAVVCLRPESVALGAATEAGAELQWRWQRAVGNRGAAFVDDAVVVQGSDRRLHWLARSDGRELRPPGTLHVDGELIAGHDERGAVVHRGGRDPITVEGLVERSWPSPCAPAVMLTAVFEAGILAAACSNGRVYARDARRDNGWSESPSFFGGFDVTVTRLRIEGTAPVVLWAAASDGSVHRIAWTPDVEGGRWGAAEAVAGGAGLIRELALAPDGAGLALLGEDGRARLYRRFADAGDRERQPQLAYIRPRAIDTMLGTARAAMRFDSAGRLVLVGAAGDAPEWHLERWRVPAGAVGELRATHGVPSIAVKPGGDLIVAGTGSELIVFDATTTQIRERYRWQGQLVKAVAVPPRRTTADGRPNADAIYAIGMEDTTLQVFIAGMRQPLVRHGVTRMVMFDAEWFGLALPGPGLALNAFDPGRIEGPRVLQGEMRDLRATSGSREAAWLAADGHFGLVSLRPTPTLVELGSEPAARAIAASVDGERIYLGLTGAVRVVDRIGETRGAWALPPQEVTSIAADAEARWVAVGLRDGQVFLFASDGRLVAQYAVHRERVSALAFASGGAVLISGSFDKTLQRYDLTALTDAVGE